MGGRSRWSCQTTDNDYRRRKILQSTGQSSTSKEIVIARRLQPDVRLALNCIRSVLPCSLMSCFEKTQRLIAYINVKMLNSLTHDHTTTGIVHLLSPGSDDTCIRLCWQTRIFELFVAYICQDWCRWSTAKVSNKQPIKCTWGEPVHFSLVLVLCS